MSLLRQIQTAAASSDRPISDLLRHCKILAARLKSAEFGHWVDLELEGYPYGVELPVYRKIDVRALGHFSGPFGSGLKNAPIPASCLPEEWRDWAAKHYLLQPVAAYEDLLRKDRGGSFQAPWPADLTARVGQRIYERMNCLSAWQEIPRGAIVAVLDSVRNRVLTFALEIENLAPDAGEALPENQAVSQERVHHVFQTTIYGSVGNIASGNQSVSQQATVHVEAGDFAAVCAKLRELGYSDEDAAELKKAIEADAVSGERKLGSAVGAWIGKAFSKAGAGLVKVSVSTASDVLPKLLARYFGLPE